MTRGAWWVAALLCLQPSALAWQDGKLTFPETAPVPSEIAKLLEQKPRAPSKYPLLLEAGGIEVEAERYVDNKNYMGTVTVTKDGIQTVIRNPRADALNQTRQSNAVSDPSVVTIRVGRDGSEATSAAFSPDGSMLYVGSYGGGVRVIDLAQTREVKLLTDPALAKYSEVTAHHGAVTQIWTIQNPQQPDQWWLVSAARDATVKVWDVQTGALIAQAGYSAPVEAVFVEREAELFVAAGNSIYRVAPLKTKIISKYFGSTNAITTVAPLAGSLWAKTADGAVMAWNLETLQRQTMYSPIVLAAVNADATRVAIKFGDNQIKYLRTKDQITLGTITPPPESFGGEIRKNRLQLSPSGTRLYLNARGSYHMTIERFYYDSGWLWNFTSSGFQERRKIYGGKIAWLPNERLIGISTVTSNGRIDAQNALYDLKTNQNITPKWWDFDLEAVSQIAWRSNTPYFARVNGLNLQLYSGFTPKSPRKIGTFQGQLKHLERIDFDFDQAQIALSPDATRVAFLFYDTLMLFDTHHAKRLAIKKLRRNLIDAGRPTDYVLEFSDDSQSLLTWNNNVEPTGAVWNASTLADEGSADCKKEVLGFLKSPRAVICNDGNALRMIPFTN